MAAVIEDSKVCRLIMAPFVVANFRLEISRLVEYKIFSGALISSQTVAESEAGSASARAPPMRWLLVCRIMSSRSSRTKVPAEAFSLFLKTSFEPFGEKVGWEDQNV